MRNQRNAVNVVGMTRWSLAGLLMVCMSGCQVSRHLTHKVPSLCPGGLPEQPVCVLYVALEGHDRNSGTTKSPFRSFERARDELRSLRTAGKLEGGPAIVLIRGGTYRIDHTLTLEKEDSGTPETPVIWMAAPGELVRFTGGIRITDWQPATDTKTIDRLPKASRANVLACDINACGARNLGSVKPGINRAELFFNNRYLTLARYPNDGFVRIANVPEESKTARPISDPKRPNLNRHAGPFNYEGNRPERWSPDEEVWVHGYWFHDWSDQHHQVEKFDFDRKELWPKPPYHAYGYKTGQRYYYLNVLGELDEPGEWYLDRTAGKIYLWPPGPIENAEVCFPELQAPMFKLQDVQHVSVRGIIFKCSRAGAVVIEGGSDCDISACTVRNVGETAISVSSGTGHSVRSCDVYEVAARGINLAGGDRKTLTPGNNTVENCHIHHFARIQKTYRPGIQLSGVGNRIAHCFIHDCPHEGIGYAGNDHTIEFTEITRVAQETGDVGAIYAAADWTYLGHVFRYNYFHHIHGPGKLGCFTVYPDLPCGGIHLYGNIFYDVDQIFHTNSGRGMRIENNIFLNARRGMSFSVWGDQKKFMKGGNWRMVEKLEDIGYDKPPYSTRYPILARLAADFAKGPDHAIERAIPKDNVICNNISQGDSFFLRLRGKAGFQHVNVEGNYIADPTVFTGSPDGIGTSTTYRNDDDRIRQILGKAGNVVEARSPGFVDPGSGDFRLRKGAPAQEIGFTPIPFAQIGLQRDGCRRQLPDPLPLPPAPPVVSPEPGYFREKVKVKISLPKKSTDATIHYTLDGSDPSRESPRVTAPLVLTETTTLKCAAFPADGPASDRTETVTAVFHVAGHLRDGISLSDLPVVSYVGYEPMGLLRDIAHGGKPLRLGGKTYSKGLITHPADLPDGNRACAEFALDGDLRKAKRFQAQIGVEDQAPRDRPGHGTVAFAVDILRRGRWERAYENGVMRAGDDPVGVDVDIKGAKGLRLIAADAGDGIAWDHATWGNPTIR